MNASGNLVETNGVELRDDREGNSVQRNSHCSSDMTGDQGSCTYSESIYAEAVDPTETPTGNVN